MVVLSPAHLSGKREWELTLWRCTTGFTVYMLIITVSLLIHAWRKK